MEDKKWLKEWLKRMIELSDDDNRNEFFKEQTRLKMSLFDMIIEQYDDHNSRKFWKMIARDENITYEDVKEIWDKIQRLQSSSYPIASVPKFFIHEMKMRGLFKKSEKKTKGGD